jgi:hypothetical protein
MIDKARESRIRLPSTVVNTQLFNIMLEMGMRDLDNLTVIGVLEQLAGTQMKLSLNYVNW